MKLHVNKKYGNVSSYTLVTDGGLSCSEKIELGSNEHKNKTKIEGGGDYGYNNNRNITENKSVVGSLLTALPLCHTLLEQHLKIFIVSSSVVIMCTIDYNCKTPNSVRQCTYIIKETAINFRHVYIIKPIV
jgi:hypothetical protein